MIVASQASEPCRSFVFGSKPYAKHPFDFEPAPSWTIYSRAKGHPHKRENGLIINHAAPHFSHALQTVKLACVKGSIGMPRLGATRRAQHQAVMPVEAVHTQTQTRENPVVQRSASVLMLMGERQQTKRNRSADNFQACDSTCAITKHAADVST